ncbi:MAG TPA: hypothetical protein VKA69_00005, partial [Desulfobacteria bacterium]|nr:hypothetical protein [Desulfobacteria bacterium]
MSPPTFREIAVGGRRPNQAFRPGVLPGDPDNPMVLMVLFAEPLFPYSIEGRSDFSMSAVQPSAFPGYEVSSAHFFRMIFFPAAGRFDPFEGRCSGQAGSSCLKPGRSVLKNGRARFADREISAWGFYWCRSVL